MRHIVYTLMLLAVTACAAPAFAAQLSEAAPGKEGLKVDGQAWMSSTEDEKLSFLLGVEMMIATEQTLTERYNDVKKENPKTRFPVTASSPFIKGWLKAFKDTSRREISAEIDKYINAHPDARTRHVFEIIWKELIVPKAGFKWRPKHAREWDY